MLLEKTTSIRPGTAAEVAKEGGGEGKGKERGRNCNSHREEERGKIFKKREQRGTREKEVGGEREERGRREGERGGRRGGGREANKTKMKGWGGQ